MSRQPSKRKKSPSPTEMDDLPPEIKAKIFESASFKSKQNLYKTNQGFRKEAQRQESKYKVKLNNLLKWIKIHFDDNYRIDISINDIFNAKALVIDFDDYDWEHLDVISWMNEMPRDWSILENLQILSLNSFKNNDVPLLPEDLKRLILKQCDLEKITHLPSQLETLIVTSEKPYIPIVHNFLNLRHVKIEFNYEFPRTWFREEYNIAGVVNNTTHLGFRDATEEDFNRVLSPRPLRSHSPIRLSRSRSRSPVRRSPRQSPQNSESSNSNSE